MKPKTWKDVMKEYPAMLSNESCAWNSKYTKDKIRTILGQLEVTQGELSLLKEFLFAQNSETGQLDITTKSLAERLHCCEKKVKINLASLLTKYPSYIISEAFYTKVCTKRRQIIVLWDDLIETLVPEHSTARLEFVENTPTKIRERKS